MATTQSNFKKSPLNIGYLSKQLAALESQYSITRWCLAYSGGVDSQVLLHLLAQTKLKVSAIYIDHGLQIESEAWALHCEQQCQYYQIPFQVIKVDVVANITINKGGGPEASARSARYEALKTCVSPGVALLTAQHRDDQSETVLLQLLRGAGAMGLSGMPLIAKFGQGWHARPLLAISQDNIIEYAQKNQLQWVEDPSNQQMHYERNFLRQTILPELKQRWSALDKTLAVFARQQAENSRLLDILAEQDLASCLLKNDCLSIVALNEMEDARLRNVLRYWFKINNYPVPSRAVLAQILQQMNERSHDTAACIRWVDVEVRRFRDKLYCLKQTTHDAAQVFEWKIAASLKILSLQKKLCLRVVTTNAVDIHYVLNKAKLASFITVRFRQGGEKIKPAGRNAHHDLKSLFQEAGVPAWQRNRIPLLYMGEILIAVTGYWLADDYVTKGEGLLPHCD